MTALVTGASGFLGGRLAQILAQESADASVEESPARGVAVRILARPGNDLRHLAGLPIQVITGSLSDAECLARAAQGVTHIYHCAACSTDWAPWPVFFAANVEGVRNLLRAAAHSETLQRFLHVSTTDVYGYPRDPCDESQPLKDVGLPYNRTKCLGEECIWEEARRSGLPVTVVRPATIYGPRSKDFATEIARLLRQGLMAVIDGGRSPGGFCYVDNVAYAMIQAAMAGQTVGRAYNLSDGTGVTWKRYVAALADGLGVRRPVINLPAAAAFSLAHILEAPHRYLKAPGRPLLTRHAVYLLSRNQEYPAERARRDFGFSPQIPFEEGMQRTVNWLKDRSP